ncbi:hypothetical protein GCM10009633_22730 [Janibacter melonis]
MEAHGRRVQADELTELLGGEAVLTDGGLEVGERVDDVATHRRPEQAGALVPRRDRGLGRESGDVHALSLADKKQ